MTTQHNQPPMVGRPPAEPNWRRGRAVVEAAWNLIYPPTCAWCRSDLDQPPGDALFCLACRERFLAGLERACPRCAVPLSAEQAALVGPAGCTQCERRWPKLERVFALGPYQDELRLALLASKRPAAQSLSAALARLFFQVRGAAVAPWQADVLVPIPMHWARRWWRGANSPSTIAEELSKSLGAPWCEVLTRRRYTRPQSALPERQRQRNLAGAFRVWARAPVQGARVLLVDDILTTGATCHAAATALDRAGAAAVAALVIGRAPLDSVLA